MKDNNAAQNDFQIYYKPPNLAASVNYIVFFTIFAIIETTYIVFAYRRHERYVKRKNMKRYICVMIPLILGSLSEATGYAFRLLSYYNVKSVMAYVMQAVLILFSPVLLTATIFMAFAEVVRCLNADSYCIVPLKYSSTISIGGYLISALFQGCGGIIQVESSITAGARLLLFGYILQITILGYFLVTTVIFLRRYSMKPTKIGALIQREKPIFGSWVHAIVVLIFASSLILIRSIYRVVEYTSGFDSIYFKNEGYFFALESTTILVAIFLLETVNFSRLFTIIESEFSPSFEESLHPSALELHSTK